MSREAKRAGIKSTMHSLEAKRLLPSIHVLAQRPVEYIRLHHEFVASHGTTNPGSYLRRQFGRDRGENFSLPYGVADCAAPPVSKRRSRSGPNLHSGDTHHCANGLFARNKHLVHDSASPCSLVLFLARLRAGAAGVETCIEQVVPVREIHSVDEVSIELSPSDDPAALMEPLRGAVYSTFSPGTVSCSRRRDLGLARQGRC